MRRMSRQAQCNITLFEICTPRNVKASRAHILNQQKHFTLEDVVLAHKQRSVLSVINVKTMLRVDVFVPLRSFIGMVNLTKLIN